MDDPFPYLIILLCLLFSAFFSGMEIAFVSADKLHIEVSKKKGSFAGRILALFTSNQSQFLATMLVGNNIALVLYGIFMARLLEPMLVVLLSTAMVGDVFVLIIQSIISTVIVLLTAEFLPKSLFLINPDLSLRLFAIPHGGHLHPHVPCCFFGGENIYLFLSGCLDIKFRMKNLSLV